jgi:hypothetical protein
MGGLGNQMFQLATAYAYAKQNNGKLIILRNKKEQDGRSLYWDTMLYRFQEFLVDKLPEDLEQSYESGATEFTIIPPLTNKGLYINGYLQSPKYFDSYKDSICKMINLDLKKKIVKEISNLNFTNNQFISLHFRFGDYKKYPHIYQILSETYYSNSITYILSEIKNNRKLSILYFCEDQDIEDVEYIIKKLRLEFSLIKFERANPLLKDWEQMLLMSLCNHNIIANSTFSWWGAYLNTNVDKIVCYPEKWFMPNVHNTCDLFLEEWVPIENIHKSNLKKLKIN